MIMYKNVKFSRIEGESGGSLELKKFNVDMNVDDIKEERGDLQVDFTYRIDYSENVGFILLKGSVLASGNRQEIVALLSAWKAKKLPEDFAAQISNVILYNCEINGVLISRVLAIPAPVVPPNLTPSNVSR